MKNFNGHGALPTKKENLKWVAVRNKLDVRHVPLTLEPGAGLHTSVNRFVNGRTRYQPDPVDCWQRPEWTLKQRQGDCEDFAILKRAYLREWGVPDDHLCLIIGYDNILRAQHAVLYDANRDVVMDCTHDGLNRAADMVHFRPIIAMTGSQQWIFAEKKV